MGYIRAELNDGLDSLEEDVRNILEKVAEGEMYSDCEPVYDILMSIEEDLVEILKSLR